MTGGDFSPNCYIGDPASALVGFSPDARFVIAEPESVGPAVAWDVGRRMDVPLIGALRPLLKSWQRSLNSDDVDTARPFAFVAPDLVLLYSRVQGRLGGNPRDYLDPAVLVSFPLGRVVSKLRLPPSPELFPAADSNFVLVRRLGRKMIGIGGVRYAKSSWSAAVEFRSGHEVITSDQTALDVLGQYYVSEPNPGEVGLYQRGKGCQATVMLHKK